MPLHFLKKKNRTALPAILSITVLMVGMDQGTKALAKSYLREGEPVVLTPFLNLTLHFNTGISFGLFSEASSFALIGFTSVAIAAVFIWAFAAETWQELMGLSMIAGGGASNVLDRVTNGAVIDFVDLHLARWHWPAFNVADIGISLGVAILLLGVLLSAKPSAATDGNQ